MNIILQPRKSLRKMRGEQIRKFYKRFLGFRDPFPEFKILFRDFGFFFEIFFEYFPQNVKDSFDLFTRCLDK